MARQPKGRAPGTGTATEIEKILARPDLKTFVLDTNVLIHNHRALSAFGRNEVVLPVIVLEEIDEFKKYSDEKGRHARAVNRRLDALRHRGSLRSGVLLENGGVLRVNCLEPEDLPGCFEGGKADNRILGSALAQKKTRPEVILITKDINLRIKADLLGLKAQDYEKEKVSLEELYPGWRKAEAAARDLERFLEGQPLAVSSLGAAGRGLLPNEGLELAGPGGATAVGIFSAREKAVLPLARGNEEVMGIRPLNRQQLFALSLLLDDRIELVTLVGRAGTGKTLLALAAGLHKVLSENRYKRFLVSRPVIPVGRDLGYLPGSKEEKMENWMSPVRDNLEMLFRSPGKAVGTLEDLTRREVIVVEALTYLRGRSLPDQFLLVDEAQNLTPLEVKTVISRAGRGTKVVLTGDPWQIDNPYLDGNSNGLSYTAERFKDQEIAGHVMLEKTERSRLAELAGQLL